MRLPPSGRPAPVHIRVPINVFHGEPGAADARIWPVKVFHGRQPYDTERNTLLVPSVGVPNDSAFWYNFDWPKALAAGAEATGAPFSDINPSTYRPPWPRRKTPTISPYVFAIKRGNACF